MKRFRLSGDETVLDFGCGYGYVADGIAPHASEVYIWDRVEPVLETALERTASTNILRATIDRDDLRGRFDLIVVNSVVQYMDRSSLRRWLEEWATLTTPDGVILLSDVPTTKPSLMTETVHWMLLALRHRVLVDAIRFARENAARYRATKANSPLTIHTQEDLEILGRSSGLELAKEPHNLAFQPGRESFVLTSATG